MYLILITADYGQKKVFVENNINVKYQKGQRWQKVKWTSLYTVYNYKNNHHDLKYKIIKITVLIIMRNEYLIGRIID